jgi:hypothetical protein
MSFGSSVYCAGGEIAIAILGFCVTSGKRHGNCLHIQVKTLRIKVTSSHDDNPLS